MPGPSSPVMYMSEYTPWVSGITKYSLIEGDLGNHQKEIDFGSVMKNLTFDQSLTRVYRPK